MTAILKYPEGVPMNWNLIKQITLLHIKTLYRIFWLIM